MNRLPEPVRVALLLTPALAVVAVFFVGGLSQGVLQSLGRMPLVGEPAWSLDAYRATFSDPAFTASLWLTARVALISTTLAVVLGVGAALVVRRLGGRRTMTGLFQSTLAIPHLVGALCIALLLSPTGLLSRSAAAVGLVDDVRQVPTLTQDAFGWGIIAEYTWKEAPFIAVIALVALTRQVSDLEDVARTLGAGRWQRLRLVTWPMLAPSVAAASVLVLAFTAASYEVPRLLGRPFPATLSVEAFRRFRDPDLTSRPEAMAIAVVVAALTVLATLAYLRLVSRLSGRTP